MIYCVNNDCRTDGYQKLVDIIHIDEEPFLLFECNKCKQRQRMSIDRFNELMQFEMDNWDTIKNDLNNME